MEESLSDVRVLRHWTYVTPNEGFLKKSIGHVSFLPASTLLSDRRLGRIDVAVGTSPTFFAAMAALFAAGWRKVPFVMDVRDLWPAIFVELGVLRNRKIIRSLECLERFLYRKAAKVVTVTESFRKNLVERGIDPAKVVTVTNGADTSYWTPGSDGSAVRSEHGLQDRFIVLYIGTHGISHALGRIVEAADRLRDNSQIVFLLVGEGAEKKSLGQQVESLGLKNVIFRDAVAKDRVREYYAAADLCLVPLRRIPLFETFIPSKMFEMMAMGKPILGCVAGEAAEVLRRSEGAVVVEPENVGDIVSAIESLSRNPARLQAMAEKGREFVLCNYSRAALARRYLDVLDEAVAGA